MLYRTTAPIAFKPGALIGITELQAKRRAPMVRHVGITTLPGVEWYQVLAPVQLKAGESVLLGAPPSKADALHLQPLDEQAPSPNTTPITTPAKSLPPPVMSTGGVGAARESAAVLKRKRSGGGLFSREA